MIDCIRVGDAVAVTQCEHFHWILYNLLVVIRGIAVAIRTNAQCERTFNAMKKAYVIAPCLLLYTPMRKVRRKCNVFTTSTNTMRKDCVHKYMMEQLEFQYGFNLEGPNEALCSYMSRSCYQLWHGLSKDHLINKLRFTNALVQEGWCRSEFRSNRKPLTATVQNMSIHHPRLLQQIYPMHFIEVVKTNLSDNTSNIYL